MSWKYKLKRITYFNRPDSKHFDNQWHFTKFSFGILLFFQFLFNVFQKANNDVDRENWLAALEYIRHHAIKRADTDEDEALTVNNNDLDKLITDVKSSLDKKLDDLRATELQISKKKGF